MTSEHQIGDHHVNHRQRSTWEDLFAHPVRHNIHWKEVEHLCEAVGSVERMHNGHLRLTIGGITEVFDDNHGRDLSVENVMDIRRMFKSAGLTPEGHASE